MATLMPHRRAELGRAGWKLFHSTMAKFPDKPTEDEKTALFSYIHLFARLYPWLVLSQHKQLQNPGLHRSVENAPDISAKYL